MRWPEMMPLTLVLWHGSAAPVAALAPEDHVAVSPRVAVQRIALPLVRMRDDAAMMIMGAALIGLASVLRRAA